MRAQILNLQAQVQKLLSFKKECVLNHGERSSLMAVKKEEKFFGNPSEPILTFKDEKVYYQM